MAQNKRKTPRRLQLEITRMLKDARQTRERWLWLSNLQLTEIPEELFSLYDVESIDLSNNLLTSIPQRLWNLPKLEYVNLYGNPIESMPNRRGAIIDLPTYRRCRDQIEGGNIDLVIDQDVSPDDAAFCVAELKSAHSPNRVTIGKWRLLIGDPPVKPRRGVQIILNSLGDYHYLEGLSLRGLKLGSVPDAIRTLRQMKYLGLDALGLLTLPDWLCELDLQAFSALDNKLSALPDCFGNLRHLKILNLGFNPLNRLPILLFDIVSLESLYMSRCNVSEIPAEILRLSRLRSFDYSNNPIQSPPEEVANKGLDAIRNYWRQRADTGVDYLCEAKLIILGEAGAGKTSLARKIKNPNYKLRPKQKSTEGIDVIRYQFPTAIRTKENGKERVLKRKFQANIWDFGGQEIYHATHQFFLTRRSVYVLVCDDRKEDTDFSYWLQVVEMLSDASPLLIVQNEKQDRTRDINLGSLRGRFTNLREALPTNLDTNRGLDDVIQSIRRELENLPHVGVGLPASWKRVREVLEQDQRDYISLDEYLEICQQRGFTRRKDKLQLSSYLHDLGICLHFQDDPLLKNTVILKPSWGTDAVYRVLDDPNVISARGLFTRKQLERIWSEEKYAGMQDELLRLMMKFQLCYALDADKAYIAPQLLSSEQPSYKWEQSGGLVIRYEYGFLPKGILTRFIVAMHRMIADEKLVWKTGVVLERDGTRAEIIEEYNERRIRVRLNGGDPHGLLAIVDEQLERLHASFPRLQTERYLPCPCKECQHKAEPYGFALEKLTNMAKKDQLIQCYESGEMIDAAQLVREILPGVLRRRESGPESPSAGTTSQISSRARDPEIFVSYAWTTESNAIVDRLQEALSRHGIRLIRDLEEVRYRDSISE